jgi:hypothetical protein
MGTSVMRVPQCQGAGAPQAGIELTITGDPTHGSQGTERVFPLARTGFRVRIIEWVPST